MKEIKVYNFFFSFFVIQRNRKFLVRFKWNFANIKKHNKNLTNGCINIKPNEKQLNSINYV